MGWTVIHVVKFGWLIITCKMPHSQVQLLPRSAALCPPSRLRPWAAGRPNPLNWLLLLHPKPRRPLLPSQNPLQWAGQPGGPQRRSVYKLPKAWIVNQQYHMPTCLPLDATGGLCPFQVHHTQHGQQLAAHCDAWHDTLGTPQDHPKGCQDRLRGGQL